MIVRVGTEGQVTGVQVRFLQGDVQTPDSLSKPRPMVQNAS